MYVKFNPNPQGLIVGDCTVRAICAVTGESWYTVHDAVCELSREMADMPSADRVWWKLLEELGFEWNGMTNQCPHCYTVEDFATDHPDGVFVLGPFQHAVAVVDGDWLDSWDSGSTVPTYYFRRKEP